jgi:hypothetical protein
MAFRRNVTLTFCFEETIGTRLEREERTRMRLGGDGKWQVDKASRHERYSTLPGELLSLGEMAVPAAC